MGGAGVATCSVCGRLSASGGDHLDCGEMRRARLEDERLGAAERYGGGDLAVEMRAVLDHMGGGEEGAGPARPCRPSALGRSA